MNHGASVSVTRQLSISFRQVCWMTFVSSELTPHRRSTGTICSHRPCSDALSSLNTRRISSSRSPCSSTKVELMKTLTVTIAPGTRRSGVAGCMADSSRNFLQSSALIIFPLARGMNGGTLGTCGATGYATGYATSVDCPWSARSTDAVGNAVLAGGNEGWVAEAGRLSSFWPGFAVSVCVGAGFAVSVCVGAVGAIESDAVEGSLLAACAMASIH